MRPMLLAPLILLGACATAPAPSASGRCDSAPVQRYVGQVATAELGGLIRAESGSSTLRWIPQGMMVTMEFNESRISVRLDGANRMTSINCG